MAKNKRKSRKRSADDDPEHLSDGIEHQQLNVDYLTTDPKSPFAYMDLIVSALLTFVLREPHD